MFLLAIALAACGSDIEPTPTAVPTLPPTLSPESATPIALTVGQLADRIAAGWTTIDRYRAVTRMQANGSPQAGAGSETVEEAILPNQRHQVVTMNGVVQSEIVATGGNIYGRGPGLPGINQPNRDPDSWITINGNVLGANNPMSAFYQSLLLPVQAPYAALDESDRAKPAEALGEVQIDNQTCQQFRIVDTTLTGERVEVLLSLAESGLVCSIQTTSDHSVTMTIYTYDQPAEIAMPASPVPAPAENG